MLSIIARSGSDEPVRATFLLSDEFANPNRRIHVPAGGGDTYGLLFAVNHAGGGAEKVLIIVLLDPAGHQFLANPVALLQHDATTWSIGKWARVEKILGALPARLEGDLILHESGGPIKQIDEAAWMLSKGYIRGASIGFIPDFDEVEMILEADGSWNNGGLIFHRSILIEWDRGARAALFHMAQAWTRLADLTAPEQKRPTFQQQQQIQSKDEDE